MCQRPPNFQGVLVVENGAKSSHVQGIVASYSDSLLATYQFVEDGNKSNALNIALEGISENHFIFFTDDDVLFDGETLLAYQQACENFGRGTVFGGRVVADPEVPIPQELKQFLPSSHTGYPPANVEFSTKTHLFIGNNWGAYSDDIKSLGGFNPLFGPGSKTGASGQESDMLMRMREAHFEFQFVDGAIVKHWVEKERLTVDFVIRRKVKDGIQVGFRYQTQFAKQKPAWKRFGLILMHRLRTLKGGRLGMSLSSRMEAAFSRGFLDGVSKGSQLDQKYTLAKSVTSASQSSLNQDS